MFYNSKNFLAPLKVSDVYVLLLILRNQKSSLFQYRSLNLNISSEISKEFGHTACSNFVGIFFF